MRPLEEIERDAAAATPGKLYTCVAFGAHPDDLRRTTIVDDAGDQVADCLDNRKAPDVQCIADATFFASARTDVPDLVERVRELERLLADARPALYRLEREVRCLSMPMEQAAKVIDEFARLNAAINADVARRSEVPTPPTPAELKRANERLRAALFMVLKSATPHPREHPTMHAAWRSARTLLDQKVDMLGDRPVNGATPPEGRALYCIHANPFPCAECKEP